MPFFAAVDEQAVISWLMAAGSRDPDVLRARKTELLRMARGPKLAGTCLLLAGLVAILGIPSPVAGSAVGLPLAGAGWWARLRGVRNARAIEAGYAEALNS